MNYSANRSKLFHETGYTIRQLTELLDIGENSVFAYARNNGIEKLKERIKYTIAVKEKDKEIKELAKQ